jgi:fructose-1,6-bisphosphatase/inositol monophosphatase family enzyme
VTGLTDNLIVLSGRLREVVLPSLGTHAARDHAGVAVGGDVTFTIDEQAEALLGEHMREYLPHWAFYSEDGGLQGAEEPEVILIVDPHRRWATWSPASSRRSRTATSSSPSAASASA